jgi:hypothetical protein
MVTFWIEGKMETLAPKKSRATHVIPIPSDQTKKANIMATLKNREILWGTLQIFKDLRQN